jgi:hypothetical protein
VTVKIKYCPSVEGKACLPRRVDLTYSKIPGVDGIFNARTVCGMKHEAACEQAGFALRLKNVKHALDGFDSHQLPLSSARIFRRAHTFNIL